MHAACKSVICEKSPTTLLAKYRVPWCTVVPPSRRRFVYAFRFNVPHICKRSKHTISYLLFSCQLQTVNVIRWLNATENVACMHETKNMEKTRETNARVKQKAPSLHSHNTFTHKTAETNRKKVLLLSSNNANQNSRTNCPPFRSRCSAFVSVFFSRIQWTWQFRWNSVTIQI